MILVNGKPEITVNVADRGLQYGDGLFETMAYLHGRILLLDSHLSRLLHGCQRLGINLDVVLLKKELEQLQANLKADSVIKVIITRGQGGRGYKAADNLEATRILASHPLPDYPETNPKGITTRICHARLGVSPSLAGMKHLNRLEQVLARNEWDDDFIKEGLMLDIDDFLIEGTMSNVFLIKDGVLLTPKLHKNGVEGVMRKLIIELAEQEHLALLIQELTLEDLAAADEAFVCNSLIGIWPIIAVAETELTYVHGPITKKLQTLIAPYHA